MENSDANVWKIYIAHEMLDSKKGFLYGYIVPARHIICIVELREKDTPDPSLVQQPKSVNLNCLGIWYGKKAMDKTIASTNIKTIANLPHTVWIDLLPSHSVAPVCRLKISAGKGMYFDAKNTTCIIYNAKDLLSSCLLKDAGDKLCVKNQLFNPNSASSNLDILMYFLHHHKNCDFGVDKQTTYFTVKEVSEHNFISVFMFYITTILCWIYFALGKMLNNRVFNGDYMREAVNHVALLHQIDLRYSQVQQIWKMKRDEQYEGIRKQNIHTRLLLDMVFGIVLMILLMKTGATDILAYYIISWADSVVILLNNLLDWLMGVPAGLKLNSQLDQFLGRFFHYHIYLWTGYLTLLKPVLAPLLWFSSIVGVLGISTQLCLLQDIFSTLTVHIYCFYVYAARLYYFQLYGLSSLWRLFRGKKWNVLRRRVDSASYDVDQLFVGTLLFTVLLFLLPTTALYYVVFLGLRLLILSVTGLVSKIVSLINTLPLHGLLLRFFWSPKISGDIMLTVLPDQPISETLCVEMQTIHVPYSYILVLLREENNPNYKHRSYSWKSLIGRVFVGELIYPWVEPALGSAGERP